MNSLSQTSGELDLEKVYPASYAQGTTSQNACPCELRARGTIKVQFLKNNLAPEFTLANQMKIDFGKILPCELRSR